MNAEQLKKNVRKAYEQIAQNEQSCGCGPSCCGVKPDAYAALLGYEEKDLQAVPAEANLSLSCGNPLAAASLKEGEVVLDLGCGAGFDCFSAAEKVGPTGRVIGVDMAPAMIERARKIAKEHGVENVEFRLGEIENLPVDDNSIDVVNRNSDINLSAHKPAVLAEIYRVLK
ncbi:MAG: methyltransferase domain-containing protein, partial [candidate division KSB1 bacterium]|nr:methyltransferase domain-containing protein [candidate division KSB1 bacterium]